jgi:hypothetical protein
VGRGLIHGYEITSKKEKVVLAYCCTLGTIDNEYVLRDSRGTRHTYPDLNIIRIYMCQNINGATQICTILCIN